MLPVMAMALPPNSPWQAALTYSCQTLLGLRALPDGPGRQLAPGGLAGSLQGEGQQTGCRVYLGADRAGPALGTERADITSHVSGVMQPWPCCGFW